MRIIDNSIIKEFRDILWPVYDAEHKKLLPILALSFLLCFVANIMSTLKTTLVVTSKNSGPEIIPFLKTWAVFPSTLIVIFIYSKVSNRLAFDKVFQLFICIFMGYFSLFLYVLYPNHELLESHSFLTDTLSSFLENIPGLSLVIKKWPFSLFYVFSELWSSFVFSTLFWTFVNELISIEESKRFFGIFIFGANISGVVSSGCVWLLLNLNEILGLSCSENKWGELLFLQLHLVLACMLLILFIFRKINKNRFGRKLNQRISTSGPKVQEEPQFKLLSNMSSIFRSKAILLMAVPMISYNFIYNLSEIIWINQIKVLHPEPEEFSSYINNITALVGFLSVIFSMVFSKNVLRRFGWKTTALMTPIIWLLTGIVYHGCFWLQKIINFPDTQNFKIFGIMLLFSSAQISLGKAAKYSLFDEAKEIAYASFPLEMRRKGKLIVDGVGPSFGKFSSAIVMQLLFIFFDEVMRCMPFISFAFLVFMILWFTSIKSCAQFLKDIN